VHQSLAWLDKHSVCGYRRTVYCPTLASLSCGPRLRGSASFHAHTTVFGDRSFSAAGCRVWNALPSYLRHDKNYRHSEKSLKGHNYVWAVTDRGALWPTAFVPSLTYLPQLLNHIPPTFESFAPLASESHWRRSVENIGGSDYTGWDRGWCKKGLAPSPSGVWGYSTIPELFSFFSFFGQIRYYDAFG